MAVGRALRGWLRKQVFRPRYAAPGAVPLDLAAADRTRVHAVRLAGPDDACASVVIVHGLTNSSRSPRIHALAHAVCQWAHAVVVDLRGHGRSGGVCTMGEFEPLDVAAAVRAAHDAAPDLPIIVVGTSLGGLAAVLAASNPVLYAPAAIAGVVSLSAPTRREIARPGAARMHRLTSTRRGRIAMRLVFRTRIRRGWWDVDDVTMSLPGRTTGFTIVVHDPDDAYFGADHAEVLMAHAPEPKELWWVPGAGHGGDVLTPEFAERLGRHLRHRVR